MKTTRISGSSVVNYSIHRFTSFYNLYVLGWRLLQSSGVLMTTIDVSYGALVPTLQIIQSKCSYLALSKDGVLSECRIRSLKSVLLLTFLRYDRCTAPPNNLDGRGYPRRSHVHTRALLEAFDHRVLWDDYGVVADIIVSPWPPSPLLCPNHILKLTETDQACGPFHSRSLLDFRGLIFILCSHQIFCIKSSRERSRII